MLIEFRVENHRSIRDEQVLTMQAGRVAVAEDPRPRTVAGYSKKLLPVAALYGANASGKSNVLSAFSFMREAVVLSLRGWAPDENIPNDPFAWGQKRVEPTSLEVIVVIDGIKYRYGFRITDREVVEEWIFAWPGSKKQTWLAREKQEFKYGEMFKNETRFVKVIEELARPHALFLSAAAQVRHSQLTPLYTWFRLMDTVNLSSRRPFVGPGYHDFAIGSLLEESVQPTSIVNDEKISNRVSAFKTLLKNADIGIVDVRATKREPGIRSRPYRFEFKHQCETDDAWLPLEEESRGTRTLFLLALPVIRALDSGSLLLVDELESSMHPNLADHIVKLFADPEMNTLNAQLIFTTHDSNLLGTISSEPILRRDQVWLTEKDEKGATVLYPLTDFKPRKDENVERGYLQGRYGAIPYLGNFRIEAE